MDLDHVIIQTMDENVSVVEIYRHHFGDRMVMNIIFVQLVEYVIVQIDPCNAYHDMFASKKKPFYFK